MDLRSHTRRIVGRERGLAIDSDHIARHAVALGMIAGATDDAVNAMSKPIPDKAEVALEYPDKFYIGTFERSSRFDAHMDATGISLLLDRPGAAEVRKSVHMHIHYALLADILRDLAKTASAMPTDDAAHRDALRDAAKALYEALAADPDDVSNMTPEDEVLLLHAIE